VLRFDASRVSYSPRINAVTVADALVDPAQTQDRWEYKSRVKRIEELAKRSTIATDLKLKTIKDIHNRLICKIDESHGERNPGLIMQTVFDHNKPLRAKFDRSHRLTSAA